MALPADFSKIYGSTATGGLTPISDVNYAKGWEFVGANPPTKNDFSYLQNLSDLKSQWLYSNKLQRTNPFGDIKADGAAAVSTALANLGLVETIKLAAGALQITGGTLTGPLGIGSAQLETDGNIYGSTWGNRWLRDYLIATFQPKGNYVQDIRQSGIMNLSVASGNNTQAPAGGVVIGAIVNGDWDNNEILKYTWLQKNVNGTWLTIGRE